MIYRIIGDIHGRTNWQKLIDETRNEITYVFVGDFTDPYYYENIGYSQMLEQTKLLFKFWEEHKDNVIILASNHDLQYMLMEGETNRYDIFHAPKINSIFKKYGDALTKAAFQIGEKYLITHAGVTLDWYQKEIDFMRPDTTMEEICDQINKLWQKDKKAFTFSHNATKFSDYYGESTTHSPIWVRPISLWENNLFGFGSGKIQVVGHTRFEHYSDEFKDFDGKIMATGTQKDEPTKEIIDRGSDYWINDGMHVYKPVYNDNNNVDIIQVDCLDAETACIEINGDALEWKKIEIK